MCYFVIVRRESERRNHSLARHADILAAVETRLSLLNMTFMKYVDSNLCCFIPGKVPAVMYFITLTKKVMSTGLQCFLGIKHLRSQIMENLQESVVCCMLALKPVFGETQTLVLWVSLSDAHFKSDSTFLSRPIHYGADSTTKIFLIHDYDFLMLESF